MEDQLSSIVALPQKDKTAAYLSLLSSSLSHPSERDLSLFLDSILSDQLAQIVARQVLSDYVAKLREIEDRDARKEIMAMSLAKMQPRVTSFEEQVSKIREQYAELLEEDQEFPEAAKVLIGIPLESGSRSNKEKLDLYIRIVRLYLEEEDSTSANTYFNRASLLFDARTADTATLLHMKLCQARMADFSRKFGEAATRYHELSYFTQIDEEERLSALGAAIQCAVLAPAGPARSRILSSLYRDERAPASQHYTILSKMFLDQMIRAAEVESFASSLKQHQLARLGASSAIIVPDDVDEEGKKGPETVLDRAVMEHNLLACSRVYTNITFAGLGHVLGLRPSAAEAMARIMIQQGRLKASLDQIESLVTFDTEEKEGDGVQSNVAVLASGAGGDDEEKVEVGSAGATLRWDQQIRVTLQMAEAIAERCQKLLDLGAPSGANGEASAAIEVS